MMFSCVRPTATEERLRLAVREFLRDALPADYVPALSPMEQSDLGFSRRLAERGWVGMALPSEYGGSGRSAVERWVVTEELLAAGAPVGGHWVADRQTGPLIARYGNDEIKAGLLPGIAAGTSWFCLGMSEPDSGSDLASVRTTARRESGGWRLNGVKIWTSGAQFCQFIVVLCRTGGEGKSGLSQLVVDLRGDGVEINPIAFQDGTFPFNEVVFTDVFVPDSDVLGGVGDGWAQVTSELTFERSGPERYMMVIPLLAAAIANRAELLESHAASFGNIVAQLASLRQLSLSVAQKIDAQLSPGVESALLKDMGTEFQVETVSFLRRLESQPLVHPAETGEYRGLLSQAVLLAPSFTVAGGTNEILRGVAARGLYAHV